MNTLIHADNLTALKELERTHAETVNLVYTDPPFATRNVFRIDEGRTSTISMSSNTTLAYADVLTGKKYLDAIRLRIQSIHNLLSENGSLYLHIDCKVGYDIKIILDEIFGKDMFRNSISRIKSNPKNFSQKMYGNMKDTILFYTKSNNYIWNEPRIPPPNSRLSQFTKKDVRGSYSTTPLHAPGETLNGATGKMWRGTFPPTGRHWRYSPARLEELDRQGKIEWSKTGNPRLKIYENDVKERGVLLQDVWEFKDPQYPAYPTEKNLSMLEMIVKTSSNPGDLVLDPYCGSGTTLLAAAKHDRQFMGIDSSDKAIECVQTKISGYDFELCKYEKIT